MQNSSYKYLAKALKVEEDGRLLLSVGFNITIYFEQGHLENKRKAVLDIFDEYYSLCGDQLHWATNPISHQWETINSNHLPTQWLLRDMEKKHVWDFYFHGGNTYDECSPFRIHGYGFPLPERSLSYLSICFPINWFAEKKLSAPETVTHWCQKINPLHGYAGFTIISSSDISMETKMAKTVFALARRFPGLEVDYPVSHSMYLQNGIKSVNWLNCLEERWIKKMGGLGSIRQQLSSDEFFIYEYNGGIIIQAGHYPQAGDLNRQIDIPPYKKLSKVLKPIRADYPVPLLGFDIDTTQQWFYRFD